MAVKTYKPTEKTNLSAHFAISEFACKCGKSHNTMIDSALVDKLEELRDALHCSKIVINSGYRCSAHDKAVGGSGAGQHTKGTAADIVCYDKDGKKISSKIVSCAAQDIGFNGIANINSSYTATHVDVGNRRWYGDETITSSRSVTDDFYNHYGLTRSDVYGTRSKSITLTIDGVTYSGTIEEVKK
ncbi:MAG: DUF882 domain-containing protein [Clostridia bacterium]|nr:DUF882 domain-containing protein [Clostridia bacterium]